MLLLQLSACFGTSFCFVAGTRVDTPTGPRPIETLAVGDTVWAFDVTTLRRVERRITALHRNTVTSTRRVTVGDRLIAGVSGEHPFWSDGAWVEARSLQVGSPVHVWNGVEASERRIDVILDEAGPIEVFNISVEGEETYFAEGVLVHNKSVAFIDTARPHTGGSDTGLVELEHGETRDLDDTLRGTYSVWSKDTATQELTCEFSYPTIGVSPHEGCPECEYAYSVEFADGSTTAGDCSELGFVDGDDITVLGGPLYQGVGLGWADEWMIEADDGWAPWPAWVPAQ
ncbi:MAG: hypothetical protein GY913_14895 [Proteobacteria bacterium]|nr:hypothetical protein [Pseudomonadota bacterium]MCP4918198.1 hypothetical protein [Pseudomonadota bacterium]